MKCMHTLNACLFVWYLFFIFLLLLFFFKHLAKLEGCCDGHQAFSWLFSLNRRQYTTPLCSRRVNQLSCRRPSQKHVWCERVLLDHTARKHCRHFWCKLRPRVCTRGTSVCSTNKPVWQWIFGRVTNWVLQRKTLNLECTNPFHWLRCRLSSLTCASRCVSGRPAVVGRWWSLRATAQTEAASGCRAADGQHGCDWTRRHPASLVSSSL